MVRLAGDDCPLRAAYVPEQDLGTVGGDWPQVFTFPNYTGHGTYDNLNPWKLPVDEPSGWVGDCCPR